LRIVREVRAKVVVLVDNVEVNVAQVHRLRRILEGGGVKTSRGRLERKKG